MRLVATLIVAASLLVAACTTTPVSDARANAQASDAETVTGLVDQYRRSIDTLDLELARRIWLTSQDATFIHPRGHERGWGEIQRNFYEGTMGAFFTERKLVMHDVRVFVRGNSAYAEFYWNFEAKMRKDASLLKTAGRESQAYLRTPQGWRLAHVHYSTMPVTGERQGF